jgi:hypothetical protein
LWVV